MKCHYLAVIGFRSERELKAYLYSHCNVYAMGTTLHGTMWAIVEVMSGDVRAAEYQSDRLSSGMMGTSIHNTAYSAAIRLLERV